MSNTDNLLVPSESVLPAEVRPVFFDCIELDVLADSGLKKDSRMLFRS